MVPRLASASPARSAEAQPAAARPRPSQELNQLFGPQSSPPRLDARLPSRPRDRAPGPPARPARKFARRRPPGGGLSSPPSLATMLPSTIRKPRGRPASPDLVARLPPSTPPNPRRQKPPFKAPRPILRNRPSPPRNSPSRSHSLRSAAISIQTMNPAPARQQTPGCSSRPPPLPGLLPARSALARKRPPLTKYLNHLHRF